MSDLRTQEEIISNWKDGFDTPLVSICCITYNHEFYIEDALKGFLIQKTDFPFEILIHDDASTDRTTDVIREYAMRYPDLIKPIYQTQNQYSRGKKMNAEYNFPRANGKYIALCEGDDYWVDPLKLQIQKDFLERNQEYVICYTDCQPFSEGGLLETDFGGARRDLNATELQKATPIYTLTTFFRHVFTGEWPKELNFAKYGDLTIWTQLGEHGKGKYLSGIKPSMYRVHEEGVHSRVGAERQREMKLQTLFSLYAYHVNQKHTEVSLHFASEIAIVLLKKHAFTLIAKVLKRWLVKMVKALDLNNSQ